MTNQTMVISMAWNSKHSQIINMKTAQYRKISWGKKKKKNQLVILKLKKEGKITSVQ